MARINIQPTYGRQAEQQGITNIQVKGNVNGNVSGGMFFLAVSRGRGR
jgi:hypothetical protein